MDEKVISNVSDLTPIADALRSTTGSTQTYSVPELTVAAVNAINAGGGSVPIDATLTNQGQAADAKAVGDALNFKADTLHFHTAAEVGADVSGAAANALANAKSYTDTQIAAIDYPVDSVNGKTGAVVLSASDVGADVSGSANTALTNAKEYTDTEIAEIPQVDWNENDATSKAYVNNRTHWVEWRNEKLVDNVSFTLTDLWGDGTPLAELSTPECFEDQTYFVVYDGTTYECKGVLISSGIVIGNSAVSPLGSGSYGNGEPFWIGTGENGIICGETMDSTHTITITTNCEIIKKIDRKFIPDVNYNLVNGSTEGSLRTLGSAVENTEYTIGNYAFAEGSSTEASGNYSHAEGGHTTASGYLSHAEGESTYATGTSSHAEGGGTVANGNYSHAEGQNTTAKEISSHAEGYHTNANKSYSHAEGYYTNANGLSSHAEGGNTTASCKYSHVEGEYNILDTTGTATTRGKYAHIVGNGTSNTKRSNAHTLDWSGNGWYQSSVCVGGTDGDSPAASLGANGLILTDETTGTKYRVYITNAKLTMEAIS